MTHSLTLITHQRLQSVVRYQEGVIMEYEMTSQGEFEMQLQTRTQRNLQMVEDFHSTDRLKTEIKRYGLNPQDWLVERISQTQLILLNRLDTDFCFLARYEMRNSTPNINQISLLSL